MNLETCLQYPTQTAHLDGLLYGKDDVRLDEIAIKHIPVLYEVHAHLREQKRRIQEL